MKFVVKSNLKEGLQQFSKDYDSVSKRGMKLIGLQLLNNIVNGSPKQSVVPPIYQGILRSSGSVFVGSELVGVSPLISSGTPNTDHSAPSNVITVGFNTAYAARMHESNWSPGPVSKQSGDTGNKFITKHLESDWEELQKGYAEFLKKELFTGGIE